MRLHVLSDLHLECIPYNPPTTSKDVVILAGDISEGINGIEWAKRTFNVPVLYVPGNHEFHDDMYSMDQHLLMMREAAIGSNVIVMDNEVMFLDGIRFIGTTLWTNLTHIGSILYCDADSILVTHTSGEAPKYFSLSEAQTLFENNKDWLQAELAKKYDGKTVVVTHHAPSRRSIHHKYEGSAWNDCFVSDLEGLMAGVHIWIHGHTHSNCDYQINNTRVICNPRGYPTLAGCENPYFDPTCLVYL